MSNDMQINDLAQQLLQEPQVDCPLTHYFCNGVYLRQITMPQDTFVIGKIHKTEHFNIVLKGKARVYMDGVVSDIEAPCIFPSGVGVQKVLYIVDEMVWATIHATNETDISMIESSLVHDSLAIEQSVFDLLVGDL